MKIINTLMLDMDGVIVDFERQFEKIIGARPENTNRSDHYKNFSKFVNSNGFEDAPECRNARKLFNSLVRLSYEYDFDINILTSDGSIPYFRDEVMSQKINWLQDHGMWLGESKFILSNGWRGKADYAKSGVFLLDDTKRNCNAFSAAGGDAFKYDDSESELFIEYFSRLLQETNNQQ